MADEEKDPKEKTKWDPAADAEKAAEKMKDFLTHLPKEVREQIEKRMNQSPSYGEYTILDPKGESLWEGDLAGLRKRYPEYTDSEVKEFTRKVDRACKHRKEKLLIWGKEWAATYPERTVLEKNIEQYCKDRDEDDRNIIGR